MCTLRLLTATVIGSHILVEGLQRTETVLAEDQFPSLLPDMKATQNNTCSFKGFNSMPDMPEKQGKMVYSVV